MSAADFRVIYRASANGKPFRVDRRATEYGNRWKHAGTFPTLPHALAVFPEAEVSELAERQQMYLDQRPHAFVDRYEPRCFACGQPRDWSAHQAGGAR